ncbi:MAG TPA: Wzz/FepE/Etk N-terminal domain-containing protein [Steroidobacteraceae bacterium]|nr:Wzz/FepE/Etk N-terminal domain-containing protein [Steroidobacteraceae bacterium]
MTVAEDSGSSASPLLVIRRRRRPLLLVIAAVLLLAALAAIFWPPRYSATGVILIEQQELPNELVRSTVSSYASQRVQIISQRVMTTENLMNIIQRYNLYASMRRRKPREEVIKKMRADTTLQMISADVIDPRDGRPTKATIAFSITYNSPSAELASKVANELVSLYLQQNIESRQQSSRDAAVFLAGESARLDTEIKQLQAKIAEFKEKHAAELPELTQFNEQRMVRLEEDIRDTDVQLRSLDQQITYLDAQLAQISPTAQVYASTGERVQSPADRLKYVRTEYARALAMYSPSHPDVRRLKREMEGLEAAATVDAEVAKAEANDDRRQLEDAQTQLASARERYSPDHPDVVRLQRLVESLRGRVSPQPAAEPGSVAAAAGEPLDKPLNAGADNPPYIQIQAQREATINQIHALHRKRDELGTTLASLEKHLASTPAVERDYNAMLRDLDSAQMEYRQDRLKQMEAQTAENLETERKGERFTLIEPPFTPEEPSSPNRPLVMIFGLMFALASGFGTVAVLENTDASVRGRRDLEGLLTAPPLATIPHMLTAGDRARLRRRRLQTLVGSAASVVVALVLIHMFYRPLDVLWAVALRRMGIEG